MSHKYVYISVFTNNNNNIVILNKLNVMLNKLN